MAEEKKDRYRFTVRFDCDDSLHRQAAEILAGMGRKKARYLAQAICFYDQSRRGRKEGESTGSSDRFMSMHHVPDGDRENVSYGALMMSVTDKPAESCVDEETVTIMKNGMSAFRRR